MGLQSSISAFTKLPVITTNSQIIYKDKIRKVQKKKKKKSPVGFHAEDTSLNDSPWNGHSKFTLCLELPNLLELWDYKRISAFI